MPPHRTHLMACLHPQNTHATQQQPHHHHCHQCSAPSPQTLTYFAARHLRYSALLLLLRLPPSLVCPCSSALARLLGGRPHMLHSPTAPALCSQLPAVQPASVLSTFACFHLFSRRFTQCHNAPLRPASPAPRSPSLPFARTSPSLPQVPRLRAHRLRASAPRRGHSRAAATRPFPAEGLPLPRGRRVRLRYDWVHCSCLASRRVPRVRRVPPGHSERV